jgi:hypothetical protein
VAVTALAAVIVASVANAQTAFVPYFGKNRVKYDNFKWQIYTTEHFEIYYYPDLEPHLERVASYAESAYQQISSDLKHDLAHKVPIVLFKTQSEFQQQNIIQGDIPEGVAAFAEPSRDRLVLPIDEPPDQLYRLITHEMTHIFEFDIIPRSLIRRNVPLWVDEGLADFMAGIWRPLDLMTVRVAVAGTVPKMTDMKAGSFCCAHGLQPRARGLRVHRVEVGQGASGSSCSRSAKCHRRRRERLQAFQVSPRSSTSSSSPQGPLQGVPRQGRPRLRRDLARSRKTRYGRVVDRAVPSGDLIATVAGNRRDQELDVVLVSAKDGQVVRNLTGGFDKDKGFEYITVPGARWNTVPWMSWAPAGDRLAYFVRTEKHRTLVVQNAVTGKIEDRVELPTVDAPESPDISPNGRTVAFSALQGAVGDIWLLNVETRELTNVTKDEFADYAPTWSPDGTYLIYLSRISGNDKLFRLDPATGKRTQLTFGTHDDGAGQFLDEDTIVFSSTATDPTKPLEPEVARNGNIYNLWTLSLSRRTAAAPTR